MKRLRWSKLLSLAAMGLAVGIASAQVPARVPANYASSTNPLAPPQTLGLIEGPMTTDYFNYQQNGGLLANPQLAVGPEDILMIVNSQIVRVPNGNSPGVKPAPLYGNDTVLYGGAGYQRAFLDNWVGETVLNQLCPTGAPSTAGGVPRDPANSNLRSTACQIDNAEVKYDQMQGRFLVLFTVVDTGLGYNTKGEATIVRPRKASWVLIVSRFGILTDVACVQKTTTVGCAANTPIGAGTQVFVTPVPPVSGNIGGINTALWAVYYGNDVATIGGDGFGSTVSAAPAAPYNWVGTVGAGNINALPGIPNSTASFDCSPGAIYTAGTILGRTTNTSTVCYLPTAARLGLDNDNVVIVSSVINANIPDTDLSTIYDPANARQVGYSGNRIRVIKKAALYNFKPTLSSANQYNSDSSGDYYDLFTSPNADGTPFVDSQGGAPRPYTALVSTAQCASGVDHQFLTFDACSPAFYEPAHLRGRALATFSNAPWLQSSQTYLVGNIGVNSFHSEMLVQGIRYIQTTVPTLGTFQYFPVLQTGILNSGAASVGVPSFPGLQYSYTNPSNISQGPYRTAGLGAAPNLFVGDSRPHSVIFREGHLYDARVARTGAPQGIFPTTAGLNSTVVYDIFQKLNATSAPRQILTTQWQNSQVFAPMFDVPANVKLVGQIPPSSILPYLEKLFTATTFPPLAGNAQTTPAPRPGDPTYLAWDKWGSVAAAGDPRSRELYGAVSGAVQTPVQLPASANCYNYQWNPGVPLTNTGGGLTQNNPIAYGSLFDVRCGMDTYDASPRTINPISGVSTQPPGGAAAYTIRGGAATDPNDGSIWVLGAYAQLRDSGLASYSKWGTMAANYKLSTPATVDEYGNGTTVYSDLGGLTPDQLQVVNIAVNVGIVPNNGASGSPAAAPNNFPLGSNAIVGTNTTMYPAGTAVLPGANQPGQIPAAGTFGPNDYVTRGEMAAWIMKSQMDEGAITAYLNATGGNTASFVDVPTSDPRWRYVETMYRRGYTKGCAANVGLRFCPDSIATRRDLAAYMIRAKMSNVFPSLISGCQFDFVAGTVPSSSTFFPPGTLTRNCTVGDNFGYFVPGINYFNDNPKVTGNDWWAYVQKMRELHITNGTSLGLAYDGRAAQVVDPNKPLTGANAVVAGDAHYAFGPSNPANTTLPAPLDGVFNDGSAGYLTRLQVATFMVRGFFY